MPVLTPNPVSHRQLHWNPADRTFTADQSDLGRPGFGQVYDDACDEGFTIVGPRGGQVVVVVTHVEVDRRENEILWWTLTPARPADRRLVTSVTIAND